MAARSWECVYHHDRRVHRHRCHACARIIETGERVLMWRIRRGTKAVHIECADRLHPCGTYRDAIAAWIRVADFPGFTKAQIEAGLTTPAVSDTPNTGG